MAGTHKVIMISAERGPPYIPLRVPESDGLTFCLVMLVRSILRSLGKLTTWFKSLACPKHRLLQLLKLLMECFCFKAIQSLL